MKSRDIAYINRAKSIPENVTIRREYITCEKVFAYDKDISQTDGIGSSNKKKTYVEVIKINGC